MPYPKPREENRMFALSWPTFGVKTKGRLALLNSGCFDCAAAVARTRKDKTNTPTLAPVECRQSLAAVTSRIPGGADGKTRMQRECGGLDRKASSKGVERGCKRSHGIEN